MGIAIRCDTTIACTFELWDHTVSLEDWLASASKLIAEPNWPIGDRHLTDLRTSDNISSIFDSDLHEVSDMFSIYADRLKHLRLALVAEKLYRKAELFALYANQIGLKARVFDDLADACEWLNIDTFVTETILDEMRMKLRRA